MLKRAAAERGRFVTDTSGGEGSMSVQDELAHARHALDDLVRAVDRLQIPLGDGPDVRRVRVDTAHLREDLDLLRQSMAAEDPTVDRAQPQIVFIPRTPYDPSMWAGCEDEGIGSRHGPERRQARPARWLPRRTSGMT
ncbi:hypothetical protein ACIGDI_19165 [Streptomyces sp. NPDC085900]|uniref:hypothetical protein n=1 Tax=Streptomyces sp. NPDC085900 TaxID=3365737 RepID=UPI0037CFB35E